MTERERLIELIERCSCHYSPPCTGECGECHNIEMFDKQMENLADHLLANGVVCPPCKVGDAVYRIWSAGKHGKSVAEFVVTKVSEVARNIWVVGYQKQANNLYSRPTRYQCDFEDFGKTAFLTKEEAEAKLKERSEGE